MIEQNQLEVEEERIRIRIEKSPLSLFIPDKTKLIIKENSNETYALE